MTSSSSLYGTVTTQNSSSTNSTSLYGGADTPIPDSSGNVIVRGDLYVLSGNILTTASTGNIFPANATTINLGLAATAVNIGANTGTTTINNNLVADSGDFANITIGVTDNQTIDTTSGELRLSSTTGDLKLAGIDTLYTDQSSFLLLNSPTTITAFDSATSLTMGETTGTTTIRNDLTVQGDVIGESADFANITIGVTDNQTIDTTAGELRLSSTSGSIKLVGTTSIYTDNTSTFNILNQPTTIGAFLGATSLNLGATTGTTNINNDLLVEGTSIGLAQDTTISYSEANNRLNRPTIQSTTGLTSGFRVKAPSTSSGATSTLSVGDSSDSLNTTFLSLQAINTATDPLRILSGTYTSGTFGPSGESIAIRDGTTTYATINPAGPTIGSDLTTVDYVASQISSGSVTSITGTTNQVIASSPTGAVTLSLPQDISTTSNVTFADVIVGDDLTVQGNNINLAQATTIGYDENNLRVNRPQIQSTSGNTTGFRLLGPNATTSSNSNFSVFGSNDIDNSQLLAIRASQSSTIPFSINSGVYTAGVFGASGKVININDGNTTYATLNPAGPTNSTDLTTKAYVDALPANITYTIDASTTTGGANFNLVGSDSTTDTVKFASGTNVTVSRTDANTITIASTDTNTTYDFAASSTTGGANLNLTGSDSTTDTVKLTNGGHITATYTSATEVTLGSDATDANTVSTIVARDASGNFSAGTITADLNGNATTATTAAQVANSLTAGTHLSGGPYNGSAAVTLTTDATDANTAGTIVARDGSGNFSAGGATLGAVTVGVTTDNTVDTTSGNLTLQTAAGVNAGTLVLTAGANGAITLAPNGTGSVVNTFSNGGNLSSNRNIITGAIRNATTASTGDMWALNATGPVGPLRGVSVDNSADTTRAAGYVARTYNNTNTVRSRIVLERARGTAASPTAVQQGDFLGELGIGGYSSTGWVNDTLPLVPAFFGFNAFENWVSNTNIGTTFALSLAPSATTITSSAQNIAVMVANPQGYAVRSDAFAIGQGKTAAFVATGCSTSGSTLTIGTVTSGTPAVGQLVQSATNSLNAGTYIISNVSGSGSGSVWNVSSVPGTQSSLTVTGQTGYIGAPTSAGTVDALQELRLLKNTVKNSAGTTVITTGTTNVAFALPVAFPVYTAAALNAITGAVGWQASVSNSPTVGGRMAFWDTTNSRWSYISDNSAV